MIKKFLYAVALAAVAMSTAQATAVNGTQAILTSGITDGGVPINTATNFTFTALTDSGGTSQTGDFLTPSPFPGFTNLGTLTFNTTTGLTIANALFGNFVTTSVQTIGVPTANAVQYYVLGNFTPGTFFTSKGISDPSKASLTIQFNQTNGGAIGGGATFASPPASLVPEPATMAMVLSGLVFAGFAGLRSRKAAK